MRLLLALLFSLVTSPLLAQVSVTIDSLPSNVGARFKVTGGNCQPGEYAAPTRLSWTAGPACQVEFLLPVAINAGTRLTLIEWDDHSTTPAITIPLPAANATRYVRLGYESLVTAEARPLAAAAVTAASRAATSALPRPYTVTALPDVNGAARGALTSDGAIALQVDGLGGRTVYLWQPERPNSALGQMQEVPALFNRTVSSGLRVNNSGRLVYSIPPNFELALWTPSVPGSVSGAESLVNEPSSRNLGAASAFNQFGQIAGSFTGGPGLWTPNVAGGTSGTTQLDSRFSVIRAMNEFGQVLSEAGTGGGSGPPLGFVLFTPTHANSADGSFKTMSPPSGATSTTTSAMNSRGDVAGTYCVSPARGNCQSRFFLWKPSSPNSTTGVMTDFAPPSGYSGVAVVSVMNDAGDMAGSLDTGSYQPTPFLRTGGEFYDLSQIPGVPPKAEPLGINNAGQILLTNGIYPGVFLLTPQPIPAPPASNAVAVTITASAVASAFGVSGEGCQPGDYSTPVTLQWTPGAACEVRWLTTQFAGDQHRHIFTGWTDGQTANPRTFTAPATASTYTATFRDEVYISVIAEPLEGGTTTGSGWYQLNSRVTITATASAGYRFGYWSELTYLDGATTQITADRPHLCRAFFALVTPLPSTYTVTQFTGMGTQNARLNNRGQVVSFMKSGAGNVTLWTPSQANGTTGSITNLSGFGLQGRPDYAVMLAFNDWGQVALKELDHPLQLWSPSTPNGTQGTYSVVNLPPANPLIGLKKMNSFGQIFGTYSTGEGFWTPSPANSANGSLTILPGVRQNILTANDRGQILLEDITSLYSQVLFMPAAPNATMGSFATFSISSPIVNYFGASAINAGGAVALTATVSLSGGTAFWRPILWTPNSENGSTGTAQVLPAPDGFTDVNATFLNSKNEVAGHARGVNRNTAVPFVFTQGRFFAIEGVPGVAGEGVLTGFNDAGQLLLTSQTGSDIYLLTPQTPSGPCPVTTSRLEETIGQAGGRVTIAISAASGCSWTATVTDPWVGFNGSASGTGNGSVLVDVTRNSSRAVRTSYVNINGTYVAIRQTVLPTASLYPSSLRIVVGPRGVTGPQDVQIRVNGSGPVTARMNVIYPPELTASFTQGSLPATMTISYNRSSAVPVSGVSTITLTLTGADQAAVTLPVTLEVQPPGTASQAPFGYFDTPLNNATNLSGSFGVTGWAMDDIEVEHVEIWRDPVGNEAVASNGLVYIGVATFVVGTRPDVEARYPSLPLNRRAGWGYLILTNTLPNGGNGVYVLEAIAVDREGNRTSLGRKTITVNNAASKKPFGAIDSPGSGETISGSAYLNSGWALTPKPSTIPLDGHTITVDIDGVMQGTINYSQFRSDISGIFPAYNNATTGGGSFVVDTTKLANGMHTIAWVVYDDHGNGDGVGSRYFYTSNSGATGASDPAPPRTEAAAAYDGDRLEAEPLSRVEFQLPSGGTDADWIGEVVVGDERRPLPIGSTLNARYGRFYWRVGPGFLGDYELEFTNRATGATHRISVGVGRSAVGRTAR